MVERERKERENEGERDSPAHFSIHNPISHSLLAITSHLFLVYVVLFPTSLMTIAHLPHMQPQFPPSLAIAHVLHITKGNAKAF
jgi:hypothetical protein